MIFYTMNNVLIIGCGGRENSITKALLYNKNVRIYCYAAYIQPFINKCCVKYATFETGMFSMDECKLFCLNNSIHYAIIGSEQYLNTNIVKELENLSIKCICPNKQFANIETSKLFARKLIRYSSLNKYNPDFLSVNSFTNIVSIFNFLKKYDNKVVIKPDGLHSGKGVKVFGDHLFTRDDIFEYIYEVMSNKETLIIEEKLEGQEFSAITITDGTTFVHCPIIQDFKRLLKNDRGPNTGSMGCISNGYKTHFLNSFDVEKVGQINEQVISKLNKYDRSSKYKGFLYGSYIKTPDNKLKIIEFNARLGDPEGISLLELLETDFFEICKHIGDETLQNLNVTFKNTSSMCKYLVPLGYPTNPAKNFPIDLNFLTSDELYHIHFASISKDASNNLIGRGSRALAVYYEDGILQTAANKVNSLIKKIIEHNPNTFHYRDDLYRCIC